MIYDAENRLKGYTKAGVTTPYGYDGDGHRVKKVTSSPQTTVVFVYNVSGQLIAEYTDPSQPIQGGGGTSYLTSDHLGSTRVVTAANGVVKARHDYLPFGEELNAGIGGRTTGMKYDAPDSTKQRFTSKERDTESGLDYFLARYYSPPQGRFTSPDEFTGGPHDLSYFADDAAINPTFYADLFEPQSLNKYQYAYNNPLRYNDPDGHQPGAAAEALRLGTLGAGASAAGPWALGGFLVYVAVDQTVGWDKVGRGLKDLAKRAAENTDDDVAVKAVRQKAEEEAAQHEATQAQQQQAPQEPNGQSPGEEAQKIDRRTQKATKDRSVEGSADQAKGVEKRRNLEVKRAKEHGMRQHAIDSMKKSQRQNTKTADRRARDEYNAEQRGKKKR